MSTVTLLGSEVVLPEDVIAAVPLDVNKQIAVSVIMEHNNPGMSLEDYAGHIASGTIKETLSLEQFVSMFAPTANDIALVTNFAVSNNLTVRKVYENSATVKLLGSVDDFNRAFGVTLMDIATLSRSYYGYEGVITIPSNLNGIVKFVLGLDNSQELTVSIAELDDNAAPLSAVTPLTPPQVATAYQYPPSTGSSQAIAIIELGGGYTQQNLVSTFGRFNLPVPRVITFPVGAQNNPNDPSVPALKEVMLDIYCAGGVAPDATLVIYFAPNSFAGFYNAVAAALYDKVNSPGTISISWGTLENSNRYLDTLFMAAIVQGVTVTVATGDYGAKANSASASLTVQYPASSPYALACGGTRLAVNSNGSINTEETWNSGPYGSAGGVSAFAALPQWQAGLTTRANPSGTVAPLVRRGIPDIAGNADPAAGYQFYYGANNIPTTAGGTSAVAPLFSGFVARVNSITRRRCGFLNPLIYSNSSAFNDITVGNNSCPFTLPGYQATPGWDACTGIGSPIGTAILNILNNLRYYPNFLVGTRPQSGQMYPRVLINN